MHEALANYLREMDPAHRAFMTIFFAVLIKSYLLTKWEAYKARQALLPIPMKLRNGVHVPNGPVQRIQRVWRIFMKIWVVYIAILLAMFIYMKAMGWDRLF